MSECNPPCAAGETCSRGECVSATPEADRTGGGVQMGAGLGVFTQWWWTENDEATSEPGMRMAWMIWPGAGFLLQTAVELLATEDETFYGFGLAAGYELRATAGRSTLGLALALDAMLWPEIHGSSESVGFYAGLLVEPTLTRGRIRVGPRFQYGHNYTFKPNVSQLTLGIGAALVF